MPEDVAALGDELSRARAKRERAETKKDGKARGKPGAIRRRDDSLRYHSLVILFVE